MPILTLLTISLCVLASSFVGIAFGLGVGPFEFSGLALEFRDDSSHHYFQWFLGGSECFHFRRRSVRVHPHRKSRLWLIQRIAGVEALDAVTVLVPRLADSKCMGIWLGVGKAWAGCGKLRDIAVNKLHLEGSEVFRVRHLVGVLNDQVGVGVGLAHHKKLFLEEVDSDHIVHCVGECSDRVQTSDVVLNNCHRREIAEPPSFDKLRIRVV